ncbi:disulfide oxidoreductase [Halobacillus sp. A5]|uniref:disulfide oxidoreductase n=1 Tax=Halobacillus sp. A5 TaxID=2880263 RepID=UPI0020A62337|nr:disulfide oxidoreductase [Halobacillus sp. A5]MCP3028801.1 disulfide bond formation protein B [Halobacillus sp. A5]
MSKTEHTESKWKDYTLYLAWLVAVIATLSSLYFSEIKGYIPCELCWFQRIFMYPLSLLLGIAAYFGDRSIIKYALPFPIIGGLVSIFHYMEQKVPGFASVKPCAEGVPCNTEYINWAGFITIPFLALTAFTLITTLLWMGRKRL